LQADVICQDWSSTFLKYWNQAVFNYLQSFTSAGISYTVKLGYIIVKGTA
jgi:hypothetical protein